jgi:tRNA (guanine37-N1)-methyltransferase
MRFSVITIFPEFFDSPLSCGLLSKAREKGLVEFSFINPRDHSTDKHHNVDDRPYGGGPGLVMAVDPIRRALSTLSPRARVLMLSPKGRPLTQALARELAGRKSLPSCAGGTRALTPGWKSCAPLSRSALAILF